MLASSGDKIPPCGVPVIVPSVVPTVVSTPAFRNALTSASTRLSPILHRSRSIKAVWSKHASMSASNTHSYDLLAKWWISATASCARRLGLNP